MLVSFGVILTPVDLLHAVMVLHLSSVLYRLWYVAPLAYAIQTHSGILHLWPMLYRHTLVCCVAGQSMTT